MDHLIRDPYGFYARKILKIKAMEWLEPDLTMREWGIRVHDVLEKFVSHPIPSYETLIQLGQTAFNDLMDDPTVAIFWWPKFIQVAEWFHDLWSMQAPQRRHVMSEYEGRILLSSFEIHSRADRIDRLTDGSTILVDYKTGEPPSEKRVLQGLAPQLLIEAFILHRGGFSDFPHNQEIQAQFWHLKGGMEGGKIKNIAITTNHIAETEQGLGRILNHYNNPAHGYPAWPWGEWLPGVRDYQHLARFKEWRIAESNKPGNETP
jgi:ATP-dependent helicase/nuclease subunit B